MNRLHTGPTTYRLVRLTSAAGIAASLVVAGCRRSFAPDPSAAHGPAASRSDGGVPRGGELVSDAAVVSAPDSASACWTHKELRLISMEIASTSSWSGPAAVRSRRDRTLKAARSTRSTPSPFGERRAREMVYSNAKFSEAEAMSNLEQVRIGGGIQALVVWRGYGTGNFYGWTVWIFATGACGRGSLPI